MANDSFTQQALAKDPGFISRVQEALAIVAFQVVAESTNTVNHAQRLSFANYVIKASYAWAQQITPILVTRTNLLGAVTSYDFQKSSVVTDATDAAIQSQISTDWNTFAS